MTELSRSILEKYQIRKTEKQKTEFINLVKEHMSVNIQTGGILKSRNIIVGDVGKADVVFTAHYDTCAVMPFPNFITPKNIGLYLLYSLIICVPIFVVITGINVLLNVVTKNFILHYTLSLTAMFGMIYLLIAGPANKHTANDNTSGVITLCEIYSKLTQEQKQKVALVFFDNEEIGLIGSALFKKEYKKVMDNKLLVNFDCVSDGDNIMFAVSKNAQSQYMDKISTAFATEDKNVMVEKGEKVYYPSDQKHFKQHVAVAALKHKKIVGYYMDRIHTPKDIVFDERNIEMLSDGAINFVNMI